MVAAIWASSEGCMQKALAFCIESWATMTESGKNPRRLRNMVDLPMRRRP